MTTTYRCRDCGWNGPEDETIKGVSGQRYCPECVMPASPYPIAVASLFASAARACNDTTPDGRYSKPLSGLFAGDEALAAQRAAREGLAEAVDMLHAQHVKALGFEYDDPADVADILERAEEDDERRRDHREETDFARYG